MPWPGAANRPLRKSVVLPAVLRTAWKATAVTNYFGDYLTVTVTEEPLNAGMVPDGTPYIELASRKSVLTLTDALLVTEWEASAWALLPFEAMERLYEAEPLLGERIAGLGGELHVRRWYRLAGSQLLGPCAHPDAVPVDTLWTRERVAWLCPECDAALPADWA